MLPALLALGGLSACSTTDSASSSNDLGAVADGLEVGIEFSDGGSQTKDTANGDREGGDGALCGNGTLEADEDCEAPFGACCDGETCLFTSPGTTCRAAAGECDPAETCTGSSGQCPADDHVDNGTICSVGTCLDGACTAQVWLTGNVLYLSFNDGTPTDQSGNGHHGTPYGAQATPGKYSQGFGFDGVDDHIEIADSPSLFLGKTLTIEAWLYRTSDGDNQTIYSDLDTSETPNAEVSVEVRSSVNGGITFHTNSGCGDDNETTVLGDNVPLAVNAWTHLAVTWDGSTLKFYLDGNPRETQPFTHTPCPKPSSAFGIGRQPMGSNPYDGYIDELKVSSYAKTDAEIQLSMSFDSTPVCGNGLWEPGEDCEAPFDLCCASASCTFGSPTSVCRPEAGPCDVAELCSGAGASCPADEMQPDGTPCAGGTCQGGLCQSNVKR